MGLRRPSLKWKSYELEYMRDGENESECTTVLRVWTGASIQSVHGTGIIIDRFQTRRMSRLGINRY